MYSFFKWILGEEFQRRLLQSTPEGTDILYSFFIYFLLDFGLSWNHYFRLVIVLIVVVWLGLYWILLLEH